MDIIYILLPATLVLAVIAVLGYIWAVKRGQFDDLDTPALRILVEDEVSLAAEKPSQTKNELVKLS